MCLKNLFANSFEKKCLLFVIGGAKREREHLVISLWHLEILVLFSELRICLLFDVWYANRIESNRIELKTLDGGKKPQK